MRIAIYQKSLPLYRVPVFNLLGSQEGIELTVYSKGSFDPHERGELPVTHFHHNRVPVKKVRWLPGHFYSLPARADATDPDKYDLVIFPWSVHFQGLYSTIRKALRKGIRVALWGHGYSTRPNRMRDRIRNRVGFAADAVMTYTEFTAEQLIQNHGFDRNRVFAAQNAIDQEPIQSARQHWLDRPNELESFQRERKLDPRQTMIFISRLQPDKKVDMITEGFRLLHQHRSEAKLIIVGGGPEQEKLETQVRQYGLSDHVLFNGPIYDDMDLAPWMLSSTLFCYPTRIGLSIMHAFGYGLPVVTGAQWINHNPEFEAIIDGENGLLFPHGDIDAMVDAWDRLMDDETLTASMSRTARETVLQKYTLANMVQGFLDLTSIVDGQFRKVQPLADKG